MLLFLLMAALAVAADQITKLIVIKCIPLGENVKCIDGIIHFSHIKNEGAAFGMLSEHPLVFQIFSAIAILAIFTYVFISVRSHKNSKLKLVSLGFIAGGGIGNMIDRLAFGEVTDFIDFDFLHFTPFGRQFDFAIFNIADAFVTVGCVALVIYIILDEIKNRRSEKS